MRFRRTGVNAPATIKIRATSQHHAKNFGKHLPRELNQIKTCAKQMKFLAVHPSCLMYSKIYLRLEPLGLELVAAAARGAGHSVRLIDLQCEPHQNFFRLVKRWQPDVIAFCVNYLANVPEVIVRSEEHTSELQSHSDLVCRLLLEKKKKKNNKLI